MGKNSRKRTILYSNVKENKKRADEITKIKEQQINLDDEIIIGMNQPKSNNKKKSQNNSSNKNANKKGNKNVSKKNKQNKNMQQNNNIQQDKVETNLKKNKFFLVIKLVIVLAIIIAGLILFLKSSFFNISQVNVKIDNDKVLTEKEIKNLSTISIGQNINSINRKEIIEKIKSNPYVESVKIKKTLSLSIFTFT